MEYNNILETKKPDKELEFFWLTFKTSISSYLNDIEKYEIEQLSYKLNKLQNKQKYDKIELYIKSHIEKIGYSMMYNADYYKISHLDTNIKRWKKLTGNDIYDNNNTFYCILKIFVKLGNKRQIYDENKYNSLYNCIKNYS